MSSIGLKSLSKKSFAFSKILNDNMEFFRIFSQLTALFGISAIPPKAIVAFTIFLLIILKLNDAQTEEISSSNLFDILYALNIFFL